MLYTKLSTIGLIKSSNYSEHILNSNSSIFNYFFIILVFLLIFFLYNNILTSLVKINLFNKKNLFFLNKNRQLVEIFMKFTKYTFFSILYKKIVFNKLI